MRWILAISMLAACFSPTAPSGLPCGPGLSCPEGQTCDIVSNECGPPSEALILRDDTADDFNAGSTAGVTVEAQGFVGPATYVTGAVRLTGYDGLVSGMSFDDVIATQARTGVAVQRSLRMNYGAASPPGLGITSPDNQTVLVEGELELDAAGDWRFQLTANDRGYLEIAAPGSSTYTRVVEDVNTGTVGTFTAVEPGWYPFRAAFEDALQVLQYDLTYDPPNINGAAFREIANDRMRVRADASTGLILDGFEHGNLIFLNGSILDSTPLAEVPLGTNPFGMQLGTSYTLRWSGQFLVDEAGDFAFALSSPDGHRLWIDGASIVDRFTAGPTETVTDPLTLAAGWHDLVIDVNKSGADATMSFTVDSGPQFAGSPVPADHLRPVPGRGARFFADLQQTAVALPDGTGAAGTRLLNLDIPASMQTPVDLRAAVELTGDDLATVSLVLDPPVGGNITVGNVGDFSGTDEFRPIPLAISNLGTSWSFIGTDTVADMLTASITSAFVTLVYDGGSPPFALTSRYESAVRDLGDAVAFERIAWTTRGEASAIKVSVRTCETDTCDGESFVEVQNASAPEITPRRFFQYSIELTSTGDSSPSLDTIELRYFVRGME